MKILFFGTPEIAVPFLSGAAAGHTVVGVVTQPDKPAARHLTLHPPEVKIAAEKMDIEVFQPAKFDDETVLKLQKLSPDLGIVVSYGKLIPEKVFNIPKLSCFNIHFSLLPKYRGAAPVQWALIKGEKETGVSSFWLEKTLDSGPIIVQQKIQIDNSDDEETLFKKLIPLGLSVMNETLELLKKGKVPGNIQQGTPTNAPILKKEDGKINWSKSAEEIRNIIRGTKLWPGAYCMGAEGKLENKRIKILKAEIYNANAPKKPGEISEIIKNKGFVVNCGTGALLIEEVQPENKNPMPAWAFLQGGYASLGSRFV